MIMEGAGNEAENGAGEVVLRVEALGYGGDGLARGAANEIVVVPFTLPGELVALPAVGAPPAVARVLEASPDRVPPGCEHFGVCGGCQYQMAAYPAQLAAKAKVLRELLAQVGLSEMPATRLWGSPEPYAYRNRIRLRVKQVEGRFRLGYNVRGSREFLPVDMCPIAAPGLLQAAQALLTVAAERADAGRWLAAAAEVELFCTANESRLQITLLCAGKPAPKPSPDTAGFARFAEALHNALPALAGMGAVRLDSRSGRPLETVAVWGTPGLTYLVGNGKSSENDVGEEKYWITRGAFFQVNRFLLPTLVSLVCGNRAGDLAWDLFAGVGLFSRVLAKRFRAVTAVEANPAASGDLRSALARLGPQHRAVEATAVDFLRGALLQRERPELIVLDPPRAGAGEEVCALLARIAPRQLVYLSCDPVTLARDLRVLTQSGYRITALHLIDLFPQTYHVETLAILERMA